MKKLIKRFLTRCIKGYFISGASTIFNIFGNSISYPDFCSKSDAEELRGDWIMIGSDIWKLLK